MMNMMYNTGWNSGFSALWSIHILSVIAFFVGVLLLIVWMIKTFTTAQLKQWGMWLTIIGAIACLLTIGIMGHPWSGSPSGSFGMMGQWQNAPQGGESSSQKQEEAEGKALYDKLQAMQTKCADLADSDFELIGEYLMGLRAGADHEQMNSMIKQMMGDDAAMHIFLARNATGCAAAGTKSSQPYGGMMNGGGMMRGVNSSSAVQ